MIVYGLTGIFDPAIISVNGGAMPRGGYRPGAGGRPLPPGERTRIISVTLRPATIRRLEAAAEASGRSRSAIVDDLITRYLPLP